MINRPEGSPNYLVTDGAGSLPVGDITQNPGSGAWVFFPSVYRKPITLKIAGEILSILQELNQKKLTGSTG